MKVPFIDLKTQYKNIKDEVDTAVKQVITSGKFILGDYLKEFEKNISEYLDCFSLGCANGSDALYLALRAIGIQKGDEIITTPFTFFATAGSIIRADGKPVFADIEKDTFNIDPKKISKALTKKTKAILPVHLFGLPCDMDSIISIAHNENIFVIEDACQAIGAEYKDEKTGTIGDVGCFSFYPTKNLGAYGDGGLVCSKKFGIYNQVKKLRVHGAEVKYFHDIVGINSRLDGIQAAILNVKLKYLDEWNQQRIKIAQKYSKYLDKYVKTPETKEDSTHIYHQYVIRTKKRDQLKNYLEKNGISTGIYYPKPLHLQECFKELGYKEGDMPVSEKSVQTVLSIPIYAEMSEDQVDYVIDNIKSFFKK